MEVNQIRLNNFTIGSKSSGLRRNEEEKTEEKVFEKTAVVDESKTKELFNTLDITGIQNKAQMNLVARKEVNPSDYLSEERISDIEAMMAEFDNGVNAVANTIEAEFPGMFAQAQKNALAARVFAQE